LPPGLIGTTVERIVGIDINPTYVAAAQARFGTQLPIKFRRRARLPSDDDLAWISTERN
jgi:hypothetical protein